MKKLMVVATVLASASVFAAGDIATEGAPEADVNGDVTFGVGTWTLSADAEVGGRYVSWRGSGRDEEGNKTILDLREGNHMLTITETGWRYKAFAYNHYLNFQILGGSVVFSGCDFMFGNYNNGTPENRLTALVDGSTLTMKNMYLCERMVDSSIEFKGVTADVSEDFFFNHMTGASQVGSTRNTATFSNGSKLTVTGAFWGGVDEGGASAEALAEVFDNKLIITGEGTTVNANGQFVLGREIKGTEFVVSDGAVFNANSATSYSRIGHKANIGGNSKLTVDGGTFVGKFHLLFGAAAGVNGNQIEVKNGGLFRLTNDSNNATIYGGYGADGYDNSIIISNATMEVGALQIGADVNARRTSLTLTGSEAKLTLANNGKPTLRGKDGMFIIENGANYTYTGDLTTGWGTNQADGNKVIVRNGGTLNGGTVMLSSGDAGNENELIVDNGNLTVPQIYLANADKKDTTGHKVTFKGASSKITLNNTQPFRFFGSNCTVELDGVEVGNYDKVMRTFEEHATRFRNGGKFILKNGAVLKANYFQHGVNAYRPFGGGLEIYDSTLDTTGGGVSQIASTSTNSTFVFSGATVKAANAVRFGQGGTDHTIAISGNTQIESLNDEAILYNAAVLIEVPAGGFTRPILKGGKTAGFTDCTFTFTGVDTLAANATVSYDIPFIEGGTKNVVLTTGAIEAINEQLPGRCRIKLSDDSLKAFIHIEPLTVTNPDAKLISDEETYSFATVEGAIDAAVAGDKLIIIAKDAPFEPEQSIVVNKDIEVVFEEGLEIIPPSGASLFVISGNVVMSSESVLTFYLNEYAMTFAQIVEGGSLVVSGLECYYEGDEVLGAKYFEVVNGALTINDGVFYVSEDIGYKTVVCGTDGSATINGGEFYGGFAGAVTIPGLVNDEPNTALFNFDASDFCENGYKLEWDEDSERYVVVENLIVAEEAVISKAEFDSDGKFVITFTGTSGATYLLKHTDSLVAPIDWGEAIDEYSATGEEQETDPIAIEGNAGFYKFEIK